MPTSPMLQQPAQPAPPPPPGMSPTDVAKLNAQLNEQLSQLSQLSQMRATSAADAAAQAATQSGGSFRALVVGSGPGGVPMTVDEMKALRMQRDEMSKQLINVAERREELVGKLAATHGTVARSGLEARIMVLDKRLVDIEREMARTGELVMMAPRSLQGITVRSQVPTVAGRASEMRMGDDAIIAISSVFTLAVLMPLAITAARIWWRRATGTIPARQAKAEGDRMEKLEQAVDSIAIEMERVSEGQRFVTRILTEGRGESPVFGAAGRGEPVRVPALGGQGDSERR